MAYTKGLHEVADGVWAYLQPDGGWGWSNAGLVSDQDGTGLLVDTLFDLHLTGEMLDQMRSATPAGANIATVVNTHANGDHCFGNSLLPAAEILASAKSAEEMQEAPPSRLAALMKAAPDLGEVGRFVQRIFGAFDFEGIDLKLPTTTFDGELRLALGERTVRLVEVGPAHTAGDVVVHLPYEKVVFTGDILFHGGHPIVWAGPVASWIAACDRILDMGAETIVPGHGPIASPQAVVDLKGYFEHLTSEARSRYDAGMSADDAAKDIDLGPYAGWGEPERIIVNVYALYRDFGATLDLDTLGLLSAMADFSAGSK